MNRDREQKTRRPNPFLTAGFFSKITFWWVAQIKFKCQQTNMCALRSEPVQIES